MDYWNVPDFSNTPFMYSDDEFAELVWKDGELKLDRIATDDFQPLNQAQELDPLLFHEDEMISWLQYPYVDDYCFSDQYLYNLTQPLNFDPMFGDVCSEFLPFTMAETAASTSTNTLPPPIVRPNVMVEPVSEANDFGMSSSSAGIFESGPSNTKSVVTELPVVGSTSAINGSGSGGNGLAAMPSGHRGGAVNTMSADRRKRKRKGKEKEKIDCGYKYDNIEVEILDSSNTVPKKQVRESTSPKRNRAAEVYNLSERKRRERINERMKILQNLIPQSNKLPKDKASLLDEAIIHLKSLKAQAMMMEGNMVPVGYPYIQPYMPIMPMGTETNPNPPIMPYLNAYAGSTFPMPVGDGQVAPACYVFPTFHVVPVHNPDPSRIPAINQPNYMQFQQKMQNMQIHMLALSQAVVNYFPYQPAMPQGTDNQRATDGFGNVDNLDPRKPNLNPLLKKKRKEGEGKA